MAGSLETTATDFSMSRVDNMRIILSNDRSLNVSKIVHVGAATLSNSVFKSSIVKGHVVCEENDMRNVFGRTIEITLLLF